MAYDSFVDQDESALSIQTEQAEESALSVSDAMALAKHSLESVVVTIIGEVSEVSVRPGYKAAYFTIKDETASLPCMMWNNRYSQIGFDLAVGQLVRLVGRFTLYAAKGRMNFDVFSLALSGEGELRLRVANLAKKLQAEGLMEPFRKRPIPLYPSRIGLVTSPRSAAVHDVLRTLRRRFPLAEVLLAGIPVEGLQAAAGICDAIQCVAEAGAEVILVVRGGGSFEDMMPFNDETLARTIAACPVPVVTGIGHEVDTSIADMVSDLRASTPTAAAEAASPSAESLKALMDNYEAGLQSILIRRLEKTAEYLERIAQKPLFQDALMIFADEAQWLDITADRLQRALPLQFERKYQQCERDRLRLGHIGETLLKPFKYSVGTCAARLEDLSPLKTLARGYSITRNRTGRILREIDEVDVGDQIDITISDGALTCQVQAKRARLDEHADTYHEF